MDGAKLFCYYVLMSRDTSNNSRPTFANKHTQLVEAFLLFNYQRASSERKRRYEEETRPERIARTMRLEGDKVSADDVRRFLKP